MPANWLKSTMICESCSSSEGSLECIVETDLARASDPRVFELAPRNVPSSIQRNRVVRPLGIEYAGMTC